MINILYEDKYLIAVLKEAKLLTIASNSESEKTYEVPIFDLILWLIKWKSI